MIHYLLVKVKEPDKEWPEGEVSDLVRIRTNLHAFVLANGLEVADLPIRGDRNPSSWRRANVLYQMMLKHIQAAEKVLQAQLDKAQADEDALVKEKEKDADA